MYLSTQTIAVIALATQLIAAAPFNNGVPNLFKRDAQDGCPSNGVSVAIETLEQQPFTDGAANGAEREQAAVLLVDRCNIMDVVPSGTNICQKYKHGSSVSCDPQGRATMVYGANGVTYGDCFVYTGTANGCISDDVLSYVNFQTTSCCTPV